MSTLWNKRGYVLASCLIGLFLLLVAFTYAYAVWNGVVWFAEEVLLPLVASYFDLLTLHPFAVLGATFLGILFVFLGGLLHFDAQRPNSLP